MDRDRFTRTCLLGKPNSGPNTVLDPNLISKTRFQTLLTTGVDPKCCGFRGVQPECCVEIYWNLSRRWIELFNYCGDSAERTSPWDEFSVRRPLDLLHRLTIIFTHCSAAFRSCRRSRGLPPIERRGAPSEDVSTRAYGSSSFLVRTSGALATSFFQIARRSVAANRERVALNPLSHRTLHLSLTLSLLESYLSSQSVPANTPTHPMNNSIICHPKFENSRKSIFV